MPNIRWVEQLSIAIERTLHGRKIHIPKDGDQSKFSHDSQKVLDNPSSAKGSRRNSNDPYGLMYVLFEAAVQNMF